MNRKPRPVNGGVQYLQHLGFWIALILKALNAAAEVVGGVFLLLLPPGGVSRFITRLTRAELLKDPGDFYRQHAAALEQ